MASNGSDLDVMPTPWRKTISWDCPVETAAELLQEIENYKPLEDLVPNDVHFPNVNVLLLGPVGAGKSSFFNTVNSVFRGKIFDVARSGSSSKSLTTKFTRHQIISSRLTKSLPFRLCDMRGLESDHLISRENIRFLLEGNISDKASFDPSATIATDSPWFQKYPPLHDQIYCCAICVDATVAETMSDTLEEVANNIKQAQEVMNSLDIQQVIVLTKVDKICTLTSENIENVFQSQTIKKCVDKVSEVFGLPRNSVFPMKNYEYETQPDDKVNILALLTLKGILNKADASLFNSYDRLVKEYTKKEDSKELY